MTPSCQIAQTEPPMCRSPHAGRFSPIRRLPACLLFVCGLAGCRPGARKPEPHYWEAAPYEFAVSVVETDSLFAIGRAAGKWPRPRITADDVTDVPARFVADPFLWPAPEGGWLLFFEILNAANERGEIGLSFSPDGRTWTYRGVVLREPFHLSYPLVFAWDGAHYMLPETYQDGAIQLYRADPFPETWRPIARLVEEPLVDSTLFRHDGRWWLFGSTTDNRRLHLYHAEHLETGWVEHPASPVLRNDRVRARMGGRVFEKDGRLFRVAQDCLPRYGFQVRLLEIQTLTTDTYVEREIEQSPVLSPHHLPWADWGTHHFDPWFRSAQADWLTAIDGYGPAQPQVHLDAAFGTAARLGGITVRPAPVRAGEPVMLRFFWHDAVPSPWTLFVHVIGESGMAFQADHEPAGRLVYHLTPTVPAGTPPGAYRLEVGLYHPETGERLRAGGSHPRRRHAVTLPVTLSVR